MKLTLKSTNSFVDERFQLVCEERPCQDSSWHYHAQYELLYISQGAGIRFVGDSVDHFYPGDLVLVGPYLPHLWRNDSTWYRQKGTNRVKTLILKFSKDFIGEDTFEQPAFSNINQLLGQSRFGISFDKRISERLHSELMEMVHLSPAEQRIKLLNLLCRLSLIKDRQLLSSTDMRQYTTEPMGRLDAVLKHVAENYASYIGLKDVADIACMTTNSFCRFFKRMTNKSFTQFLNEVRIRNASRMLLQDQITVSEVCYSVGYNSITNFYKKFKEIMGCTPKRYRQTI